MNSHTICGKNGFNCSEFKKILFSVGEILPKQLFYDKCKGQITQQKIS